MGDGEPEKGQRGGLEPNLITHNVCMDDSQCIHRLASAALGRFLTAKAAHHAASEPQGDLSSMNLPQEHCETGSVRWDSTVIGVCHPYAEESGRQSIADGDILSNLQCSPHQGDMVIRSPGYTLAHVTAAPTKG